MLKCYINNDISQKIAKMIPLNFNGWWKWKHKDKDVNMCLNVWYRLIWIKEGKYHGLAPCLMCLRPCIYKDDNIPLNEIKCETMCINKGKDCYTSRHFRKYLYYCEKHGYQNKEIVNKIVDGCVECGIFGICKDKCMSKVFEFINCEPRRGDFYNHSLRS